jgi:hypothetical protein
MFDYVVCFYFGHRRAPITNNLLLRDKYILVKRHLDFIKKYLNDCEKLNNIYFMINSTRQNDDGSQSTIERLEIEEIVNSYGLDNVILVQRKNIDFSYGAWNEAILLGMNSESEYAFLSEDDYIPKDTNFYEYFIKKFDSDTAYVCQLYIANGAARKKVHAAMSSGFISYEKAKSVYEQYGSVLKLVNKHDDNIDTSYHLGQVNQVDFLDYFHDYKITDVSEETFSVFLDIHNTQTSHGNLNGVELIVPIT